MVQRTKEAQRPVPGCLPFFPSWSVFFTSLLWLGSTSWRFTLQPGNHGWEGCAGLQACSQKGRLLQGHVLLLRVDGDMADTLTPPTGNNGIGPKTLTPGSRAPGLLSRHQPVIMHLILQSYMQATPSRTLPFCSEPLQNAGCATVTSLSYAQSGGAKEKKKEERRDRRENREAARTRKELGGK